MFIGLDAFGDFVAFDTFNIVDNFYRLELMNMKADEVNIKENVDTVIDDESKEEWHYTQVLLALFQNNLEAGNLQLDGMPVEYIKIKKRKKEDLLWNEMKYIPFDKNVHDYYFIDKYVEALQTYEYAVQPVGADNVVGNNIYSEIEADFEGVWLVDKDRDFQLFFNLEISPYETVVPTSVIETLGGQYPVVFTNDNVKYRQGQLKCMLVSNSTESNGAIDRRQEKILRNNIMSFLTDKKPKLYKDSSGEMMVIMLSGNPTLTPINELSQQIYNLEVEFVEVARTDSKSLIENGLLDLEEGELHDRTRI